MSNKSKSEKFPLIVKAGSSIVKIYRDIRSSERTYYRVVFHLGGKRQRLIFRDLHKAKNEASAKAAQLARGDVDAAQLTGKDRLTYGRALDAIRPFDIALDAAAIEYVEARKTLKGHSLIEATRFFMKHHGRNIIGRMVADAVEDFRQAKEDAGRSPVYLKDIRLRLRRFAKCFNVEVRQLSAQDVANFLHNAKMKARSFNNTVGLLRTFFAFCVSRAWLSKDIDLLAQAEKRTDRTGDIEIFTPKELRAILAEADPTTATCIAIQAFAGLRTAELMRLTWQDVDRRSGYIEVTADKSKTASRRLVPISKNLSVWLRQAERQGDRVWPVVESRYHKRTGAAAQLAGDKSVEKNGPDIFWKKNALRHSFISYRVAQSKDMASVALEAGNSPTVIFQHYRELVTIKEAKEWFGIVPPKSEKNIISITRKAA